MSQRDDTAHIKMLLQARIDGLLATLLPDGRRAGAYYIARNPTRNDERPGSFWIKITGVPGVWRDEATGDKGDVLSLIGYIKGLEFKDVMAFAKDFLNIRHLDDETIRHAKRTVDEARAKQEKHDAWRLTENRKGALAEWLRCNAKLEGSMVEVYLATRGIDLAQLKHRPNALRSGVHRHHESGQVLPVMMACMTGPDGTLWARHTTYLRRDGSGKADVSPQRKIWPSFKGAAIRLSRGETGMSPTDAAKHGLRDTLAICEGVEDGLSLAMAMPELRVWAVGSLGNLGHVQIPECAGEVIVAVDNDWGKPQAAALLQRGIDALARQGRPLKIARSHIGKDANDALRGQFV